MSEHLYNPSSPSRILLSLKTPPISLDERDNNYNDVSKGSTTNNQKIPDVKPLSFDQQQQHHNSKSSSNVPIEMTPSFPLFNTSFDSIGDTYSNQNSSQNQKKY